MAIWYFFPQDTPIEFKGEFCKLDYKDCFFVEYFKGCVLELREWNDYDDSNFYAIVWNDERQCLERHYYASTRFYSNSGAEVDVTPEVQEKVNKWIKEGIRRYKIQLKWNKRQELIKFSNSMGITRKQVQKLLDCLNWIDFENVSKIMSNNNKNKLRSNYRKSLCNQIINWLNDENPKYKCPLSINQLNSLMTSDQKWKRGDYAKRVNGPKGYRVEPWEVEYLSTSN